jgi:hypothetical protein
MISKQKARRVTVGNTAFRHKVSTTPVSKGVYRLNITVQSEVHNASKLVVLGLIQKDVSVWPLTDFKEIQYYPTVTRHEVEWCIREAINIGWDYGANGQSFVLQVSNEIFHPGFSASERAANPIVPESSTNNETSRTRRPS